ncbi:hypothetical protein EQW78_08015 [Oerskovia turbata]|uniref:Uncharacterized protein n=1 Tax=Oerskovia turbata TaxID=1713 RepID=A0A4Q1KW45_9CELL|nr:hypothetical protein [Oerskovia turbata]RXR26765.1 hypothetical protein EQW73_04520 [Oerskovia turbata]RXR34498.1 hypothetical protein EQW78_08015 [Oerskovia turbata]TGJ97778.1 hypothetical protein DLJ96_07640 [Actinotalea fermentans ATCC 43279 = JCM 9966 = DSM 3133]
MEGEYFPTAEYPHDAFLRDFALDFGTTPEIVSLDVTTPTISRAASTSGPFERSRALAAEIPEHQAQPVNNPRADNIFARGVAEAKSKSLQPLAAGVPTWGPGYTEIAAMTDRDGRAVIYTYNSWANGRSPAQLHWDWGMEIDVSQFNNNFSGTRPGCASGFQNAFFATQTYPSGNGVHSWAVYEGSDMSTTTKISPYFDKNSDLDPCNRQSMAIGLGSPQEIRMQNGGGSLQTIIRAPRGNVAGSPMSAAAQALSNDCNDLGMIAQSDCMGINVSRPFPGPGSQSMPIVGAHRNIRVPTCTYTTQPSTVFEWKEGIGAAGCIQG